MSTNGLDYLPRANLAEASNNDESIMNIQRIREFVRTLSIMDICWLIPDSLDVFAFKTVGNCWSAKFRECNIGFEFGKGFELVVSRQIEAY